MEAYPDGWQSDMFVNFREILWDLRKKRTFRFKYELNDQAVK